MGKGIVERGGGVMLFLTLLMTALSPAPIQAATPSFTVSRSAVIVETGGTTTLLLDATSVPRKAHVLVDADPGVGWSLRRTGPTQWLMRLGPKASITTDTVLTVQLVDAKGVRVAATNVTLTPKPLPSPDSVAQVALTLDGGGLAEGRSSRVYLTVTNKTEHAIALRRIQRLASTGLVVRVGAMPSPVMPRETKVLPLTIDVGRGVPRAGTHLLGIAATLTTDLTPRELRVVGAAAGAPGWTAQILATKEVELTVPGISELQGVLQIPTLLLLPGLLAIIAFAAILDLAKPRPVGENPFGRLTIALSPGLWVVMITISAGVGFAYVLLTGRDILYGFGIRDVVWLWFASLILGSLVGCWAFCRERRRQLTAAAPRFTKTISPPTFLAQLVREGETLRRQARYDGEQALFDLGPGATADEVWACGAIAIRPAGAFEAQVFADIRDAANDALRVAAVERFLGAGKVTLEWRPFIFGGERIAEPQIVSPDLFKGLIREDDILREVA